MAINIRPHGRYGPYEPVTNKRQLRKAASRLVDEIGSEEYLRPDEEHRDVWLTDANDHTLVVDMFGCVALKRDGEPPRYLGDLPYAELEDLLTAFGTADWDAVLSRPWSPDRPSPKRPRYLHAANQKMTDLHRAACLGDLDWVQAEIAAGADIRAGCDEGTTPLHRAAATAQLKICGLLIDAGADVNAPDRTGMTPLDYADCGDEYDFTGKAAARVEKLLKKHGAVHSYDDE
ncbi:ankyrin repeat domain-containing protein [Lignipirellula cremea]|uniref:Ankyrin repeats (3 copies) n=1 Tax=Lignipirellula cremea TaxID=2528010 RepID=A0A518DKZ1_9BACT|nr:ankyrin repeat domain-containing protein [Lignipirellula cremea]QDU92500.1 Ankyrin repeats (3 copies) [Lignipirellula cremea]